VPLTLPSTRDVVSLNPERRGSLGNLTGVLRAYGDGKIFGEAFGDGPADVVWLHGWARSSTDFAVAGAQLAAAGVSSVALDLPGSGASPPPTIAGGAVLYAGLVRETLTAMGGAPVVLVGHSFGGRVATVLAADHPELIATLVLTGAPLVRRAGATDRAPRGYRWVRAAHRRGWISEARMEAARQKYGSLDYRRASGVMRDVLVASVNESYEEQLGRIVAPVDLVWGRDDHDVPVAVAERARELLTRSRDVTLEVLADTGHLVPSERPDALVARVLSRRGGA